MGSGSRQYGEINMATTATEENKQLARRDIEEVWNQENYDLIDELYTAEFVHHDPAYPDTIRGPEGQRKFVEMYNSTFQGKPSITIENLVAEGDFVTIRWTGHGTHEEEFMGVEPTQKEIEISGLSMARVEDGKIAEMWTNYDALGMLSQIGGISPPPE